MSIFENDNSFEFRKGAAIYVILALCYFGLVDDYGHLTSG